VPTFEDRGCHVVSVADPYGRILGFLDQKNVSMEIKNFLNVFKIFLDPEYFESILFFPPCPFKTWCPPYREHYSGAEPSQAKSTE
jgi:hypothetical protein